MSGLNLDVPDEYDEWPHDARAFVLAEANTAQELRQEIDSLAGMEHKSDADAPQAFTTDELAQIVMALGGWSSYDAIEPYLAAPTEENINRAMADAEL